MRIVGASVATANYLKVPDLMKELANALGKKERDIIKQSAVIHSRFEQIHPFSDGNGRVGRLLLCAQLLRANFPPAIIHQEQRRLYMAYLQKAQKDRDTSNLEEFLCDAVMSGFNILERK